MKPTIIFEQSSVRKQDSQRKTVTIIGHPYNHKDQQSKHSKTYALKGDKGGKTVRMARKSIGKAVASFFSPMLKRNVMMRVDSLDKTVDNLRKADQTIVAMSSVFPFKVIPDTLKVSVKYVTFIYRCFRYFDVVKDSYDVEIKDVLQVKLSEWCGLCALGVVMKEKSGIVQSNR